MKIIWHFWEHWYRFKRHHCVLPSNCSFLELTCQNVLIAALTGYRRATARGWTRDCRASLKADLTFGNQSPVTGLIGLQICTLASLKASGQHSEGKAPLNTHFFLSFRFPVAFCSVELKWWQTCFIRVPFWKAKLRLKRKFWWFEILIHPMIII